MDERELIDAAKAEGKPTYYEEGQIDQSRSCSGLMEELKACLLATDCVKVLKKTPKECLRSHDPSVPNKCFGLRLAYLECKRSMLDPRHRFRGKKGY